MADSARLQKLLERISDGGPVDWDDAKEIAETPEDEKLLGNLRIVSAIGELARSGGAGDAGAGDPPFEKWGDLRLLERIGAGSFGEVWRAWDTRLNREVALKLIAESHADTGARRARILDEGRLLAKVEHANVARVYGVGEHEGRIGFWMERIDGHDLRQIMQERGPLPVDEVTEIGIDVAKAVAAAHAAGVVHRDIKPANVMRDRSGRVVLTDFGVGSLRRTTAQAGAEPPSGTPLFLAPEIFEGEAATPASDVYAIGVLLHHLATGGFPVAGDDLDGLIASHRSGARTPVREQRGGGKISGATARVIDRATAHAREDRFPDAEALLAALRSAAAESAREETPSPATPHPRVGAERDPQHDGPGRTRKGPLLAIVALVLVAAAFALTRMNDAQAPVSGSTRYEAWNDGARRSLAGDSPVSPRDRLSLALSVEPDAHVYLLNLDEAGAITVLFPMEGHPLTNPLPGGRSIALPGTFDGVRQGWTLSDTPGTERFLLIASREPLTAFEETLARYPSVPLGGGLSARPVTGGAVRELTRGVSGMAGIVEPPARTDREPAELLIDLLRQITTDGERRGDIWVEEMRFENGGS